MFKRANKITALLVAAASVMSVVPAMAADSSARLGTKDGTVEHAVAYKDGKYVYQGYKTSDDTEGVYYNAGDKDKALDNLDSADLSGAYSTKYAYAVDGSDKYLVDLTSGDVIDDQTPADDLDNVATKLKSALKKTDRYGDAIDVKSDYDNLTNTALNDITPLAGDKFDDTWYQYAITTADTDAASNVVVANGNKLYGFTNQAGKYIDASNIANIYAYSSKQKKVVKIDEFSNSNDDVADDSKLLATLVDAPEVLAQDKDYIYAKVTVQIADTNASTGDLTGTTTSAAVATGLASTTVTTRTYIQKISKAQGDKKDDAYLPKTVASYEVTKGELDCGDANDAYDAINDATSFSAVNGQLLAITTTNSNVKVQTINLKKDKVKFKTTKPASLASLDTKVDVYLAEKDSDDDVDIDASTAVDTDVDGNVWAVGNGKIYEFSNNAFNKIYTTDNSLDALNVYDKSSLIAWNQDDEIYTTVNEGTAETAAEAPVVATTPATVGWSQLADGTWNFYDATGTKVASNWVNVGGAWYYLKADGVMATGWLNDNGTWYYLAGSGAMKTGWLNDNGTWYYLNASGAMLANTTVDGYVLNASGAWVK